MSFRPAALPVLFFASLLLPLAASAGASGDAAKVAAAIGDSQKALESAASCHASKERFDQAYADIKKEADRREEGCSKARLVKGDLQCGDLGSVNKSEASCCIYVHDLVANHIESIGGELQKACGELVKAEEKAAKCQSSSNNQQCAFKARAPHLRKAANHLKAMNKLIKDSRMVQDKARGYSAFALSGMIDHIQNDAKNPSSLCQTDPDFFHESPQSMNEAFSLGLSCSGDNAADKKILKQRLDAMTKYREDLIPKGDGKDFDPRQRNFGPYVEEEANSVWIAHRLDEERKKLEPMTEKLAMATDYQATQAESAGNDMGSLNPPSSDVTGAKPGSGLESTAGGSYGGSGLSGTTGASSALDYARPDGSRRQAALSPALAMIPSAFSGNLSYPSPSLEAGAARAEGTSPTPLQHATNAAKIEEAARMDSDSAPAARERTAGTGLAAAAGQTNKSDITLAKNEGLPLAAARGVSQEASPTAEAARAALAEVKPERSAKKSAKEPAEALAAGAANASGRGPASESARGQPAEEAADEGDFPRAGRTATYGAGAPESKVVEELSRNPSLREALRKKLESSAGEGGEMDPEKHEALERMLAQAEKLAGERGLASEAGAESGMRAFSMDPAETERAIGRLLAQLDSTTEESLFSRVRSAYKRVQRKDAATGKITL